MEVELKAEEDPEEGTPDSQEAPSPQGPQSFNLVDNTDAELLQDFITEGFDHLDQAEEALLLLENKPKDVEAINVVFRAFHTIKGVAGFLELDPISTLAHHAESLLSSVREGSLAFSSAVARHHAEMLRHTAGSPDDDTDRHTRSNEHSHDPGRVLGPRFSPRRSRSSREAREGYLDRVQDSRPGQR